MKKINIVFATNNMIHYTKNLCESFLKNENVNEFHLIVTRSLGEEYTSLGMDGDISALDYVVELSKDREYASSLIKSCDLLIGQYYIDELMRERVKVGKITFVLSERVFKKYDSKFVNISKNIIRWFKYKYILNKGKYYSNNVFFLAIGKYSIQDYIKLGIKRDHIMQFAYFPKVNAADYKKEVGDTIHLIWVGRMLSWKHPEYAVNVCKYLTKNGICVDLKMIGDGPEINNVRELVEGDNNIHILGGLPTDRVREEMNMSDIFLFTSNQGEGWGVVLNEAMAEGLVAIASDSAGSTSSLINDGVNGLIYYNDDLTELEIKAEELVKNPNLISSMSVAAKRTIETRWNSEVAVANLIGQFMRILNKQKLDAECGPGALVQE